MTDQADRLRSLVSEFGPAVELVVDGLRMIVVTGARAGVGTTTVAVNLAAVLADRGERVLLVDGAQHCGEPLEAGGPRPNVKFSLADVLSEKCEIGEAIVEGPAGVQMLLARGRISPKREIESRRDSATSGDFSRHAQDRLFAALEGLVNSYDTIIVDAGRGFTPWSRRFWSRAKLNVLVTTAEDSAVLDAYAVFKESMGEASNVPIRLLVNQAASEVAACDAHRRIANAALRFLSRSIQALPALPVCMPREFDVARGAPRVWEVPNSVFGHAALWLGRAVSDLVVEEVRSQESGVGFQEFEPVSSGTL